MNFTDDSISIDVLNYTSKAIDGFTTVHIPTAVLEYEEFYPIVPSLSVYQTYTPGTEIQDIVLISRQSKLIEDNLSIPVYLPPTDVYNSSYSYLNNTTWHNFPLYSYKVDELADGCKGLKLVVSPVQINSAGEVHINTNFTFKLIKTSSKVEITDIFADKPIYSPGDSVNLTVVVNNFFNHLVSNVSIEVNLVNSNFTFESYIPLLNINTPVNINFSIQNISSGTHWVVAKALDSDDFILDQNSYSIFAENPLMTSIISPINNTKFKLGETINFDSSVSGGTFPYEYNWTSSINGVIGNESIFNRSDLSVGNHTIKLGVIDKNGVTSTATCNIIVTGGQFDTEAPTNPYPSIAGTHNGTITPSYDINVSRLYTYPCSGTGGHTEYAKIWNTSWVGAEARWNGYVGDWHNLSFDKNFTLVATETYNYTIHTGSYPQIIHETPFNATGGTITCDKFSDANGRIYYDWIPAIKLFL